MGKKRYSNDYYELIIAWLKGCGESKIVSAQQIAQDLIIENNVITVFLCRYAKKGYLKRVSTGRYQIINPNIPIQLSKGLLPDLIFDLLKDLNTKLPNGFVRDLYLKEKINNPSVSLNSIHSVIQRWYDMGILVRNSRGKGVRLKDEYLNSNKRPLAISKRKL